ncbi:MAG TPA: GTPase [Pirellulales bacterium]|jgi:tRNA modification GTPase|nr:GTPase [Pirellulales bacterium]
MLSLDDTIAAVATASNPAARGIVRLSGPQAVEIISRCFVALHSNADWTRLKQPTAISGHVSGNRLPGSSANNQPLQLPADLFLWPTTRSYTRQPLAEIHSIGSPPLLQTLLQAVCNAGARLAEPGEFTLRAFLAGRLDLTQAEAVLGVVDAANRQQLHAALEQLAGGLSHPLQQLRSNLLNLLADLEAGLDFVEDDIRFITSDELKHRLADAAMQMEITGRQLDNRTAGAGLPRVVLLGWPNVGKSSLFNALLESAAALVSPQAGTTRDYLVAVINAAGLPIELIDTAGMMSEGESRRPEDVAAQSASEHQQGQADLQLLCLDATRAANDWEQAEIQRVKSYSNTLIILTKCDAPAQANCMEPAIRTSSHSGQGLNQLRRAIRAALAAQPNEAGVVAGTAARVRESLRLANEALLRAQRLVGSAEVHQAAEELLAAELRLALGELGKVVGAVYTDDLLDCIFSRFCIGK